MPLKLDNESELREAQAALFNINSFSGWVLLNYVGPSTVHFAAGGEGGVDELKPHLEHDQIQYALVRTAVEEHGVKKFRDVFICSIGKGVGIIEKGKKTALLGDAQNYLQPHHANVTVLAPQNLSQASLLDRSNPLSGSNVINDDN
eukprot:TRINITY_DN544_c0_g1_i1.p1 TRINITY_DN544_c0_g1~~TRINITY_DN544_c0_g1_i1.p1  ORF type:complete len:169 (+),score=52.55 TRINITY_DN544_c0_g1_i1:70-507(+)